MSTPKVRQPLGEPDPPGTARNSNPREGILRTQRHHLRPVRDCSAVDRLHVEDDRCKAGRADLDLMRSGYEFEMLKRPVEVVYDAGVIAVHIHFRIGRRAENAEPGVTASCVPAVVSRRGAVITRIAVAVRIPICADAETQAKGAESDVRSMRWEYERCMLIDARSCHAGPRHGMADNRMAGGDVSASSDVGPPVSAARGMSTATMAASAVAAAAVASAMVLGSRWRNCKSNYREKRCDNRREF